jgi:lipoprotein-anchoring transpeptidase ErfK/SrfK
VTLSPQRSYRGFAGIVGVAVIAALVLSSCSSHSAKADSSTPVAPSSSVPVTTSSAVAPVTTPPKTTVAAKPKVAVHIRSLNNDGATYGVAMPIIIYFNKKITDATAFAKAATVKVNGASAKGAWYFETSPAPNVYEAHYRPQHFWPANSAIAVDLPMKGLSAGANLAYDDSLTLNYQIGDDHETIVDGNSETMTVTDNGVQKFKFPVSLGKAKTPSYIGTKVVMEKDAVQHMVGTPDDPYSLNVPWSVRLTNSGEFIHSAPWNTANIGRHSTSNGCTNLATANALAYFNFAQIGDPAIYSNTGGPVMPTWDGYGDWNVPWSAWQAGGLFNTT